MTLRKQGACKHCKNPLYGDDYGAAGHQCKKAEIDVPIAFNQTLTCPICGELHEIKWQYKGVPLLACPKMEPDKIYFTGPDDK